MPAKTAAKHNIQKHECKRHVDLKKDIAAEGQQWQKERRDKSKFDDIPTMHSTLNMSFASRRQRNAQRIAFWNA